MSWMFDPCENISTIYASDKWSIDMVTNSMYMFYKCLALKGIIAYSSNKLDATYANYETGYFTYKASSTTE